MHWGASASTVNQPFLSDDPAENADNNDPEWELLRKLETDEERYKAVRERWRSIVVPNPNRNLTHRSRGDCSSLRAGPGPEPEPGPEPPTKRRRTQSCTAVLCRKFVDIESAAEEEHRKIRAQQLCELRNLHSRCHTRDNQYIDREYAAFYVQRLVDLRRKVEGKIAAANNKRLEDRAKLKDAIEEVKLFNKFYEGLEAGLEDAQLLSEAEVEELVDEEKLYDDFEVFYRQEV